MFGSKKGQSTLEVVMLIGFVIAALIAMNTYMKRGVQGRLRQSADQVGEQYEAGKTTYKYETNVDMRQTESMSAGGGVTTTIAANENVRTKKSLDAETVAAWATP